MYFFVYLAEAREEVDIPTTDLADEDLIKSMDHPRIMVGI
jgi:hypothetical protein